MFSTIQRPSRSFTWITLSLLPSPMSTNGRSLAPTWIAVGASAVRVMRRTLRSGINLFDPDIYVDGPPHEEFARLRRENPVCWQDLDDGTGCWAVLTHADLTHVAREPRLFSASEGGVVLEDLAPENLAMMRNMLLAMDPPRHAGYRRPLLPTFSAGTIGR